MELAEKSAQPKSSTSPQSNLTSCSKSPIFSETDWGADGQTEPSCEYVKSPVFGRNTQRCACKHHDSVCSPTCENSEFIFSSQDSLTPSTRFESCHPKSPVFASSPSPPKSLPPSDRSVLPKSPHREEMEWTASHSTSPVFSLKAPRRRTQTDIQKKPESPSAAGLQGSNSVQSPSSSREVSSGVSKQRWRKRPLFVNVAI